MDKATKMTMNIGGAFCSIEQVPLCPLCGEDHSDTEACNTPREDWDWDFAEEEEW